MAVFAFLWMREIIREQEIKLTGKERSSCYNQTDDDSATIKEN